ncbi:hypothetical protein C7212DRAFT_341479 [Tuber magnatum]|uniref:Uncharacterized protein n=1 Tax=Tuber magnatum TaxID=42249 RepID=A0A317SWF3_9PEZI|nr:hypothetical protein C7212DRAFT_341479 [Tuber magnatum]
MLKSWVFLALIGAVVRPEIRSLPIGIDERADTESPISDGLIFFLPTPWHDFAASLRVTVLFGTPRVTDPRWTTAKSCTVLVQCSSTKYTRMSNIQVLEYTETTPAVFGLPPRKQQLSYRYLPVQQSPDITISYYDETSTPTYTQAMASLGEEMDTTRSSTPETPTPEGLKEDADVSQTKAAMWEFLAKYGPAKMTPTMEMISRLTTGDVFVEGIRMLNLVLGLANQVKALTVMVQNLARTVQDQEQVIKGATRPVPILKNKSDPGGNLDAKAAAQPPAETTAKKRKRKADEGPIPPKPPQAKAVKGDLRKDEGESKGWQTQGPRRRPKKICAMVNRRLFAVREASKPPRTQPGNRRGF